METLPTVDDISAALAQHEAVCALEHPSMRCRLRREQEALTAFWYAGQRFSAQRDAVEIYNACRGEIFKLAPVIPAVRLFTWHGDPLTFYPSTRRIAELVMQLPGAGNRCRAIAAALGTEERNVRNAGARLQKEVTNA